jgi:hypothetical protein
MFASRATSRRLPFSFLHTAVNRSLFYTGASFRTMNRALKRLMEKYIFSRDYFH